MVGSLLGDGCLRIMGRCKFPAFSVSHGKDQKNYLFWKYEKLKRWVSTPPWQEERIYHKDRTRKTVSWRFQTLSNSAFSRLYDSFYKGRTKVVPENIVELLSSPLTLSVWIMDDGNKNHNAVFLNTQGFTLEDQLKLIRALGDIYGLNTTVNKHSIWDGRQLYRIRVDNKSTKKLAKIVRTRILPEFYYKIPNFSP